MKRVLVTGARGFLGAHCLQALAARGWSDVHAVSRATCDLFDPGAVRKLLQATRPSHALHLAWDTTPGKYWTSPDNQRWLAASETLLEEFAAAGGRRFVAAGTCAEYEWSGGKCSEKSTPLKPASPYGAAKHALQEVLARRAPALGVSAAWGRVFFPYGPGERPERLVAYVIRSLLAGRPADCTSGEHRRDFIYAGDAGDAFAALLGSDLTGPVNVGTGEAVAVKDVVLQAARQAGRADLVRLGVRPLAAGEPAELFADLSRLQGELGWRARTSLEQGLAACVDHWRRHG
jgi:nucleoside-diphosphate-sugar epimerase